MLLLPFQDPNIAVRSPVCHRIPASLSRVDSLTLGPPNHCSGGTLRFELPTFGVTIAARPIEIFRTRVGMHSAVGFVATVTTYPEDLMVLASIEFCSNFAFSDRTHRTFRPRRAAFRRSRSTAFIGPRPPHWSSSVYRPSRQYFLELNCANNCKSLFESGPKHHILEEFIRPSDCHNI